MQTTQSPSIRCEASEALIKSMKNHLLSDNLLRLSPSILAEAYPPLSSEDTLRHYLATLLSLLCSLCRHEQYLRIYDNFLFLYAYCARGRSFPELLKPFILNYIWPPLLSPISVVSPLIHEQSPPSYHVPEDRRDFLLTSLSVNIDLGKVLQFPELIVYECLFSCEDHTSVFYLGLLDRLGQLLLPFSIQFNGSLHLRIFCLSLKASCACQIPNCVHLRAVRKTAFEQMEVLLANKVVAPLLLGHACEEEVPLFRQWLVLLFQEIRFADEAEVSLTERLLKHFKCRNEDLSQVPEHLQKLMQEYSPMVQDHKRPRAILMKICKMIGELRWWKAVSPFLQSLFDSISDASWMKRTWFVDVLAIGIAVHGESETVPEWVEWVEQNVGCDPSWHVRAACGDLLLHTIH